MQFPLSHFVLHAPSVGLAYWFVSHDFAEALGLEYSRDAARELKQLVGDLGARVDYEADAVTIRIKRTENVIPVLRAIHARLQYDAAELQQAPTASAQSRASLNWRQPSIKLTRTLRKTTQASLEMNRTSLKENQASIEKNRASAKRDRASVKTNGASLKTHRPSLKENRASLKMHRSSL